MRILITGHTGFIGQYVERSFLDAGYDTVGYSTSDAKDVCQQADLMRAAKNVDAIVNLAGRLYPQADVPPAAYWRVNAEGAATVFRVASQLGIKVIQASSYFVQHPTSEHYSASKAAAELAAQAEHKIHDTDIVILRLCNVYGPGQPDHCVIPIFTKAARKNKPITLHNGGHQLKDWVYVEDVARAFVSALSLPSMTITDVGSGRLQTVRRVGELVCSVLNVEPNFLDVPDDRGLQSDRITINRALAETGWCAKVVLEDGIARQVESIEY